MKTRSSFIQKRRGSIHPAVLTALIIVVILVVGVLSVWGWYMKTYNRFVSLDEQTKSAWAQVDNQLQRRYDLIPNLVNTVKGYAQHEDKVLNEVTEARARVGSAQTVTDKIHANGELTSALGRLLVVAENYPNLKANENFLDLQAQLEGTENRIAVARRSYNEAAQIFNQAIRGFLEQFVARRMRLEPKTYFEAEKVAQKAPEVKF
jgi:LemA protein